jgi:osmotically-inducible protein OsmY
MPNPPHGNGRRRWDDAPPGYGSRDGDRPAIQHTGYRRDEPVRPPRGGHRGKGPQGYQRSDERIRELVCEALTDDDHVDATHVEVTVRDGEVTLAGIVDDRPMKRRAEEVTDRVPGVRDVHNQIRLGHG